MFRADILFVMFRADILFVMFRADILFVTYSSRLFEILYTARLFECTARLFEKLFEFRSVPVVPHAVTLTGRAAAVSRRVYRSSTASI
jgi:hypothetical protein